MYWFVRHLQAPGLALSNRRLHKRTAGRTPQRGARGAPPSGRWGESGEIELGRSPAETAVDRHSSDHIQPGDERPTSPRVMTEPEGQHGRARMTEPTCQRDHGLAGFENNRGIGMPKDVEAVLPANPPPSALFPHGDDTGRSQSWLPDLDVEDVGAYSVTVSRGQHQGERLRLPLGLGALPRATRFRRGRMLCEVLGQLGSNRLRHIRNPGLAALGQGEVPITRARAARHEARGSRQSCTWEMTGNAGVGDAPQAGATSAPDTYKRSGRGGSRTATRPGR